MAYSLWVLQYLGTTAILVTRIYPSQTTVIGAMSILASEVLMPTNNNSSITDGVDQMNLITLAVVCVLCSCVSHIVTPKAADKTCSTSLYSVAVHCVPNEQNLLHCDCGIALVSQLLSGLTMRTESSHMGKLHLKHGHTLIWRMLLLQMTTSTTGMGGTCSTSGSESCIKTAL